MDERVSGRSALRVSDAQGTEMLQPDEVAAMVQLSGLGWGAKRLAREFGCARNTVRRYLRAGGPVACAKHRRATAFDGLEAWLRERFFRHGGNADVVRQELAAEHGIHVGLRHIERRVAPWRRELKAQALATLRFETPPGRQLQIDFGETRVWIGPERVRVRLFVRASMRERQADWFAGIEGAFVHFGGVTAEVLLDNARALVEHHDAATREVAFNAKFRAFAQHWRFVPKACAPYRARTKGKDERGVGYVKKNAIAGRLFASWSALEAHLAQWCRDVADVRVHGTTGEPPIARFTRDEAAALKPLGGRAPFGQLRDLVRRVQSDCAVDVDTNSYSAPWRLIGESVQVMVLAERVVMATKIAQFPFVRDLDGFDWSAQPSLDPRQIRELATCRWIAHGDALLLLGPPPVGKTHLAVSLGREAIRQNHTVSFTSAATLVATLAKAQADGRLDEQLTVYARPKLLIVDDLGYLPLETQAARLFFQLVSRHYEKGSTLVTSNRSVGEWGTVFNDPVVATAILDRLLHHSHVVTIRGDSYRLREKRRAGLLKGGVAAHAEGGT